MNKLIKIDCYIQEYKTEKGLCARLRDKETDKIVELTGQNVNKAHFLQFLSQAKIHQDIMPTIYDREGNDIVAIRGELFSETNDKIIVNIDTKTGGYIVE